MRFAWLLAVSALGNLLLYSVPLVHARGACDVVAAWLFWTAQQSLLVDVLVPVDRAPWTPWGFVAVGVLCQVVAWRERGMREVLPGGWVMTAMLMVLRR